MTSVVVSLSSRGCGDGYPEYVRNQSFSQKHEISSVLGGIRMAVSHQLKSLLSASVIAITTATAAGAQDNTPSMKFGRGELVSPAAARSYYDNDVNNPASTDAPAFATDPEIKALAASLGNDADLIFEYVHDKVAFVPTYGLQKGALGTYLDKSGNAFDQAQLLVELLEAANYQADYVLGDVTVTADEFKSWFGVENKTAACRILADGGIPATFSGASASCGGLSGDVTGNVTLSHVWVSATVGGQTKLYDPAFKKHEVLDALLPDLKAEMGYSAGSMLTTAGGSTSGATAHNFNTSGINSSLNTLSSTLMGVMNNGSHYDKSMDELLGAELIEPLEVRRGPQGNQYAGVDADYSAALTNGDIPDAYRTLVTLDFTILDQSGTSHVEFYGDELYGRRLAFDWKNNDSSVDNPSLAGGRLTLDDQFVATINTRIPGDTTNPSLKIADGNATKVKFDVNHAYASNGGAYMDRTYQRAVGGFSQSVTFVFGFGGTSDAVTSKLTGEHYRDTHYTADRHICDTSGQVTQSLDSVTLREIKLIEHLKTQVGYGWLSQFSRAVDLQARAVDAVAQHHHSFGLAYTSASWADACEAAQNPNFTGEIYSMTDSAVQLDMVSGLSVNHRSGSEAERKGTTMAMAVAGATLEGSVFEQFAGKAHTSSTAERFEWFNANTPSGQAFRIVDNADWQTINNSLPAAEKLSGYTWFQRYSSAGYIIVAPQGDNLGSGANGGAFPTGPAKSFERGSAFIALRPDGSEAAHIVLTGMDASKGGGAQQEDDEDGAFDPSKVADTLRDQFEDRSRLHGVDLSSGQVSYSPPADITTGAGEFPYALSFQRSYNTSGSRARGMGVGWTHNWDISASASGSATEAMGATRAVRAVPSLVAFTVLQDIYAGRNGNFAKDVDTLKRAVTGNLVAHWWREHLQNNVVTVQQGANGIQFVKLPGEVFDGPTGSNATLEYVGSGRRQLFYLPNDTCAQNQVNIDGNRCRTGYRYPAVKYRYTSADGDTILFDAGRDALNAANSNIPQFLPDEWEFAAGIKIKFTHDSIGRVTKVQSNLGGSGVNDYTGPALNFTWGNETISSVSGTGLGSVQFTYASGGNEEGTIGGQAAPGFVWPTEKNDLVLASVTDLVGNSMSYEYIGNGLNAGDIPANVPSDVRNDWLPRLYQVYTAEYAKPGEPYMEFSFDADWRAVAFADGEALRDSNRGNWAFQIAPGFRGARIAPTVTVAADVAGQPDHNANPTYEVRYDIYGNAAKVTDEGGRVTTATYDGINRVEERVFPSGSKSQFAYDIKSNVVSFTTVAVGGASSRTVTATYTDTDWVTKPTSVKDARGNTTSISYNAANTIGAGQPALATLPPVDGRVNQYSYSYNVFGQPLTVTDPENMVTASTYHTSGFLASTTVDSGRKNLTTAFTYNAAGDQLTVNGPLAGSGDTTITSYDAARRPLEQTDPVGTISKTIYDRDGRTIRTEVRSGGGALLQVSGANYTATGQQYETFSPECYAGTSLNRNAAACAITTTTYDAMDRSDIVTDPVGRKSQTRYYTSGDVAKVMRAVDTSLEQAYQTYTYVLSGAGTGQVATVADANGNTTTYTYDIYNRLNQTQFPSKDTVGASNHTDYELYEYDFNDNQRFKRTRAGDWIENIYDEMNRVESKIVRRGSKTGTTENTVNYTYDLVGRDRLIRQIGGTTATGITIPAHNIYTVYDTAGRIDYVEHGVTAVANSNSQLGFNISGGRKVDIWHDAAGRRNLIQYPGEGSTPMKTVNFTYDAAGRMTTVDEGGSSPLASYAYDALSRKTGVTYLNGAGSAYDYHIDSAIERISQSFINSDHNVSYTFGYNKANQVTTRSITNASYVFDGFAPEGNTDYGVNGLNQYTETVEAPLLANGQVDLNPNTSLETVTVTNYSYDLNGSLIDTNKASYVYDAENRLVEMHDKVKGLRARFQYDGKGRRIAKLIDDNFSGSFTADKRYEYLYEGDEPIQDYLEVSSSYIITNRYVHGAAVDERLVHWQYDQNTGAETHEQFYHRDHQGSIIAMSNANGNRGVGELYTYDAYGNQVTGSTTGQPFRYTGRRYDQETGLYYYRARYCPSSEHLSQVERFMI